MNTIKKILNMEKKLSIKEISFYLESQEVDVIEIGETTAWIIMPGESRGLFIKTRDLNTVAKIKNVLAAL